MRFVSKWSQQTDIWLEQMYVHTKNCPRLPHEIIIIFYLIMAHCKSCGVESNFDSSHYFCNSCANCVYSPHTVSKESRLRQELMLASPHSWNFYFTTAASPSIDTSIRFKFIRLAHLVWEPSVSVATFVICLSVCCLSLCPASDLWNYVRYTRNFAAPIRNRGRKARIWHQILHQR